MPRRILAPGEADTWTVTVDAARDRAWLDAEAAGDDHGPSCRCGSCLEDRR